MNIKKILAGACIVGVLFCAAACVDKTPAPDHDLLSDFYNFDLDEYITLGQYKNIVVKTRDPAATEEELEEFFTNFLNQYAVLTEITDRTDVREGDVVNIDYSGSVNGETSSSMSSSGDNLEIGSGSFIPGFEEALIGAKVNDEVTFDITFPDDYWNSQMAGVAAMFSVKINAVYQKTTPELTDELIAEETMYSTVEEYREFIRGKITESNQQYIDTNFEAAVWETILANAEIIKYPDEVLNEYKQRSQESIDQAFKEQGITVEEYVADNNMTVDEFYEIVDNNVKAATEETLVIYAIVKAEGVKITWEEYQELAKSYFNRYSVESLEELEEKFSRKDICEDMAFNNVLDIAMETAKTEIVTE